MKVEDKRRGGERVVNERMAEIDEKSGWLRA